MTEIGDTIAGRYLIEAEIGRGGFSIVYAAKDTTSGEPVALKLLVPPPASAEVALERLRREVRAVERLEHPSIARVHALIEEKERAFIVMERVSGESLAARVRERGPLPIVEVQAIGVAIARALEHAHHALILHRDVKPENIMVPAEGPAKLVDFGSARVEGDITLTRTGGFVGTLDYSAPEVLDGARPDGRADVYGLGMALYFAITGALPKRPTAHLPPVAMPEGHRPSSVAAAVPGWLDAIVARATAADARQRFPTISAMLRALEAYRGHKPLAAATFCLGCGKPLAGPQKLCRACQGQPADTLMFVEAGTRGRAATEERLVALGVPEPAAVAAGMRPLVGIRRRDMGTLIERLDREGVPVRLGVALWPQVLVYGVSVAVLLSAAVMYGFHHFGWAALGGALAAATVLSARAGWRAPVVSGDKRGPSRALPAPLWARVARAQVELEDPAMSGVLGDLAEMAQALGEQKVDRREIQPRVERLFEAAVTAAQSIKRIDALLGRLGDRAAMREERARAEEARSALVQRMLESTATMTALVAGERVAKELEAATADLANEVKLRDEAMAEVDALSAGTPAPRG